MKDELFIKVDGKWVDLYSVYGVVMDSGFVDAICTPYEIKEYVTNECRSDDGTQYLLTDFKAKEGDLSLNFKIIGTSASDLISKRKAFFELLYTGLIHLYIRVEDVTIKVLYSGKGVTYKTNRWRNVASVKVKFKEPNPKDRTSGKN